MVASVPSLFSPQALQAPGMLQFALGAACATAQMTVGTMHAELGTLAASLDAVGGVDHGTQLRGILESPAPFAEQAESIARYLATVAPDMVSRALAHAAQKFSDQPIAQPPPKSTQPPLGLVQRQGVNEARIIRALLRATSLIGAAASIGRTEPCIQRLINRAQEGTPFAFFRGYFSHGGHTQPACTLPTLPPYLTKYLTEEAISPSETGPAAELITPTEYTPHKLEQPIADLLRQGKKVDDVARELGVHRATVYKIIGMAVEGSVLWPWNQRNPGGTTTSELHPPPHTRTVPTDTLGRRLYDRPRQRKHSDQEIADAFKNGHDVNYVAQHLGMDRATIYRRINLASPDSPLFPLKERFTRAAQSSTTLSRNPLAAYVPALTTIASRVGLPAMEEMIIANLLAPHNPLTVEAITLVAKMLRVSGFVVYSTIIFAEDDSPLTTFRDTADTPAFEHALVPALQRLAFARMKRARERDRTAKNA